MLRYIFSRAADNSQQVIHINFSSLVSTHMKQCAFLVTFQFHGSFIGFDLGKQLSLFYRVAHFFMPGSNNTLRHRIAQARHQYHFSHDFCSVYLSAEIKAKQGKSRKWVRHAVEKDVRYWL